ncbi:sensor domain-containing diguanylate cyclase [Alkalicoccobacillus murimartini]|uniref:Diguanylate cyclase (GGDEF)-like protein/PAS domain S-box-containing protein n=1 Tax=Alkalicoccobacillus murimartini TaxID=171685 RepID=A0ABT9YEC1_9BACI|nr:sensor domain-containing diguanylate cyclase [Alkalicoccobacillus murimartini]MDQ0206182.1 diguanylate cyclase (GGDEF)-like protein/PAS domain S-box-containing protein [Alkalicoccobacillus murimartini]
MIQSIIHSICRLLRISYKSSANRSHINRLFKAEDMALAYSRLHIICWGIIMVSPIYLFMDIKLYGEVGDSKAFWRLTAIHMISLVTALVFVVAKRLLRNPSSHFYHRSICSVILYGYVGLYLVIGAVGSINSQGISANVDSYIVIMMGVATVFALHPLLFSIMALFIHTVFMILLYQVDLTGASILIKQINTTAAVGISILVVTMYYFYRKNNFIREKDLRESETNFRSLFEVNPYPLLMIGAENTRVRLVNKQALQVFGGEAQEAIRNIERYLSKQEMIEFIQKVKREGACKDYIVADLLSGGKKRWLLINGEFVDFNQESSVLIGFSDITHLKETEEDLLIHASRDSLTGCYNRRTGMNVLQELIQEAKSPGLVICFIDINNLKSVNDQYGHSEGDQLIQTMCQIIEMLRDPQDVFFRYGGDEFVLVFSQCSLEQGKQKWQQIHEALDRLNHVSDRAYLVSVSCGFSFFEQGMHDTIDELILKADKHMYINKKMMKTHLISSNLI